MSRPPPPNHQYSFDHHDDHNMNSQHDPYGQQSQPYRDIQSSSPAPNYMPYDPSRTVSPPQPPVHRRPIAGANGYTQDQGSYPGQETYHDTANPFQNPSPPQQHAQALGYTQSMRTASTTTPGMDNLGHAAAGGGIAGIAMGVASTNERESGVQAMKGMPNPSQSSYDNDRYERNYQPIGTDTPYIPDPPQRRDLHETGSYSSSTAALGGAGAGTGWATPQSYHPSEQHIPLNSNHSDEAIYGAQRAFGDTPNKRFSSPWDPRMDPTTFHPDDIEDDGDDGMGYNKNPKRNSMLAFGQKSQSSLNKAGPAGAVAPPLNGHYAPASFEKSGLRAEEKASRKRKKTILIVLGAILLMAIIGGAITAGILASRKPQGPSRGQSAADDDGKGDLNKNSGEIQALMNNANLHRVFPGVAYTPFNGQYPECITNPPSQNNITRDVAVLSQLTKVIRLYGTDCNQTDMVLHALNQLSITDMKIWIAVWLDNNATTNARGLSDMYDIIKRNGADPFSGVVVGNEVLFREQMTVTELGKAAANVKSNLTAKGVSLPVAIADLGDKWEAELVKQVDVVMSNIHPFFGGPIASKAADWTKNFWTTHDVVLTQGTSKKNIISEVGWPSAGGNKCGANKCKTDTDGSVAGIDELNTFMSDFVCQSLDEGVDFIW